MRSSRVAYRLSPNEEILILQREKDRRRKLRIQQVREQERHFAKSIRDQVQVRKKREMQILAGQLEQEWLESKLERKELLEQVYKKTLEAVGQAHTAAEEQPAYDEIREQTKEINEKKAKERGQQATKRQQDENEKRLQEEFAQIMTRKTAMEIERARAALIARKPKRKSDVVPAETEAVKEPTRVLHHEGFSTTHYTIQASEYAEKADPEEQGNAKEDAQREEERLKEEQQEKDREQKERRTKASLRQKHAQGQEKLKRDREQLLAELDQMEQADRRRRQLIVSDIPKQIFQPPHKRLEEKDENQKDMEQAFENMYMANTDYAGDIELALEPSPPAVTADLDVSSDTPGDEFQVPEPKKFPRGLDQSRTAPTKKDTLKKLLLKIHTQKHDHKARQKSDLKSGKVDTHKPPQVRLAEAPSSISSSTGSPSTDGLSTVRSSNVESSTGSSSVGLSSIKSSEIPLSTGPIDSTESEQSSGIPSQLSQHPLSSRSSQVVSSGSLSTGPIDSMESEQSSGVPSQLSQHRLGSGSSQVVSGDSLETGTISGSSRTTSTGSTLLHPLEEAKMLRRKQGETSGMETEVADHWNGRAVTMETKHFQPLREDRTSPSLTPQPPASAFYHQDRVTSVGENGFMTGVSSEFGQPISHLDDMLGPNGTVVDTRSLPHHLDKHHKQSVIDQTNRHTSDAVPQVVSGHQMGLSSIPDGLDILRGQEDRDVQNEYHHPQAPYSSEDAGQLQDEFMRSTYGRINGLPHPFKRKLGTLDNSPHGGMNHSKSGGVPESMDARQAADYDNTYQGRYLQKNAERTAETPPRSKHYSGRNEVDDSNVTSNYLADMPSGHLDAVRRRYPNIYEALTGNPPPEGGQAAPGSPVFSVSSDGQSVQEVYHQEKGQGVGSDQESISHDVKKSRAGRGFRPMMDSLDQPGLIGDSWSYQRHQTSERTTVISTTSSQQQGFRSDREAESAMESPSTKNPKKPGGKGSEFRSLLQDYQKQLLKLQTINEAELAEAQAQLQEKRQQLLKLYPQGKQPGRRPKTAYQEYKMESRYTDARDTTKEAELLAGQAPQGRTPQVSELYPQEQQLNAGSRPKPDPWVSEMRPASDSGRNAVIPPRVGMGGFDDRHVGQQVPGVHFMNHPHGMVQDQLEHRLIVEGTETGQRDGLLSESPLEHRFEQAEVMTPPPLVLPATEPDIDTEHVHTEQFSYSDRSIPQFSTQGSSVYRTPPLHQSGSDSNVIKQSPLSFTQAGESPESLVYHPGNQQYTSAFSSVYKKKISGMAALKGQKEVVVSVANEHQEHQQETNRMNQGRDSLEGWPHDMDTASPQVTWRPVRELHVSVPAVYVAEQSPMTNTSSNISDVNSPFSQTTPTGPERAGAQLQSFQNPRTGIASLNQSPPYMWEVDSPLQETSPARSEEPPKVFYNSRMSVDSGGQYPTTNATSQLADIDQSWPSSPPFVPDETLKQPKGLLTPRKLAQSHVEPAISQSPQITLNKSSSPGMLITPRMISGGINDGISPDHTPMGQPRGEQAMSQYIPSSLPRDQHTSSSRKTTITTELDNDTVRMSQDYIPHSEPPQYSRSKEKDVAFIGPMSGKLEPPLPYQAQIDPSNRQEQQPQSSAGIIKPWMPPNFSSTLQHGQIHSGQLSQRPDEQLHDTQPIPGSEMMSKGVEQFSLRSVEDGGMYLHDAGAITDKNFKGFQEANGDSFQEESAPKVAALPSQHPPGLSSSLNLGDFEQGSEEPTDRGLLEALKNLMLAKARNNVPGSTAPDTSYFGHLDLIAPETGRKDVSGEYSSDHLREQPTQASAEMKDRTTTASEEKRLMSERYKIHHRPPVASYSKLQAFQEMTPHELSTIVEVESPMFETLPSISFTAGEDASSPQGMRQHAGSFTSPISEEDKSSLEWGTPHRHTSTSKSSSSDNSQEIYIHQPTTVTDLEEAPLDDEEIGPGPLTVSSLEESQLQSDSAMPKEPLKETMIGGKNLDQNQLSPLQEFPLQEISQEEIIENVTLLEGPISTSSDSDDVQNAEASRSDMLKEQLGDTGSFPLSSEVLKMRMPQLSFEESSSIEGLHPSNLQNFAGRDQMSSEKDYDLQESSHQAQNTGKIEEWRAQETPRRQLVSDYNMTSSVGLKIEESSSERGLPHVQMSPAYAQKNTLEEGPLQDFSLDDGYIRKEYQFRDQTTDDILPSNSLALEEGPLDDTLTEESVTQQSSSTSNHSFKPLHPQSTLEEMPSEQSEQRDDGTPVSSFPGISVRSPHLANGLEEGPLESTRKESKPRSITSVPSFSEILTPSMSSATVGASHSGSYLGGGPLESTRKESRPRIVRSVPSVSAISVPSQSGLNVGVSSQESLPVGRGLEQGPLESTRRSRPGGVISMTSFSGSSIPNRSDGSSVFSSQCVDTVDELFSTKGNHREEFKMPPGTRDPTNFSSFSARSAPTGWGSEGGGLSHNLGPRAVDNKRENQQLENVSEESSPSEVISIPSYSVASASNGSYPVYSSQQEYSTNVGLEEGPLESTREEFVGLANQRNLTSIPSFSGITTPGELVPTDFRSLPNLQNVISTHGERSGMSEGFPSFPGPSDRSGLMKPMYFRSLPNVASTSNVLPQSSDVTSELFSQQAGSMDELPSARRQMTLDVTDLSGKRFFAEVGKEERGYGLADSRVDDWSQQPNTGSQETTKQTSAVMGILEEPDLTFQTTFDTNVTLDSVAEGEQTEGKYSSPSDSLLSFIKHEEQFAHSTPMKGDVQPPSEGGLDDGGHQNSNTNAQDESQPLTLQEALARHKAGFIKSSQARQRDVKESKTTSATAFSKTIKNWQKAKLQAQQQNRKRTGVIDLKTEADKENLGVKAKPAPKTSQDRKAAQKADKERTKRLYNQLEEVKSRQVETDRKKAYAENRRKRKEYEEKLKQKRVLRNHTKKN